MSGFISKEQADDAMSRLAKENALAYLNASRELRTAYSELLQLMAAMVISSGGRIVIGEREWHAAKQTSVITTRDANNMRWIVTVKDS